jgi:hypothetical protein
MFQGNRDRQIRALKVLLAGVTVPCVWLSWYALVGRFALPQGRLAPLGVAGAGWHSAVGSELKFAQPSVDLGVINKSTQVLLPFTNVGPHSISGLSVRPNCACAVSLPNKSQFEAGEHGEISVTVEPRLDRIGPQSVTIDCEYVGTTQQSSRLTVRYHYAPELVVPPSLALESKGGQVCVLEFEITDFRATPVDILDVSTSSSQLKGAFLNRSAAFLPGWVFRLELRYSAPSRDISDYSEAVYIHTNDPIRRLITIPVQVSVRERIRAFPQRLQLSPNEHDACWRSGSLLLDDSLGGQLSVKQVCVLRAGVEYETKRVAPGKILLLLKYPVSLYVADVSDFSVTVHFDSPETTAVTVLVTP